jgi:uncharacterized LabA/DUF88 family protein
MARLAIFVDGGYLDEIAENCGVRIDFVKLADEIKAIVSADTAEPVSLVRTYYYICPPYQGNPPSQEDRERYGKYRHFADALERLPKFQIREGRLEARGVGDAGKLVFVQKRLDLLLGLDFASLSAKQAVTHIALVAGDSDLIPAVQIAKQEGVPDQRSRSFHSMLPSPTITHAPLCGSLRPERAGVSGFCAIWTPSPRCRGA